MLIAEVIVIGLFFFTKNSSLIVHWKYNNRTLEIFKVIVTVICELLPISDYESKQITHL